MSSRFSWMCLPLCLCEFDPPLTLLASFPRHCPCWQLFAFFKCGKQPCTIVGCRKSVQKVLLIVSFSVVAIDRPSTELSRWHGWFQLELFQLSKRGEEFIHIHHIFGCLNCCWFRIRFCLFERGISIVPYETLIPIRIPSITGYLLESYMAQPKQIPSRGCESRIPIIEVKLDRRSDRRKVNRLS